MNTYNKSIEEIYQYIGQSIVDCIDDDWSEAWIRVQILEEDNGSVAGRYKRSDSDKTFHFRPKSGLFIVFRDIRRRLVTGTQLPWKVAKFWMRRDGEFKLDFEYDDENRWE